MRVASIIRSGINGNSICNAIITTRNRVAVASIIRSGINGNEVGHHHLGYTYVVVASIIRSGINGNFIFYLPIHIYYLESLLLLEVELMETIPIKAVFLTSFPISQAVASIIRSGINGNPM